MKPSASKDSKADEVRIIGLTGGIASGKSTAAKFFAELGIPVVDADQVSRELSAPGGRAHTLIEKRFGTADRARLSEIVFNKPQARRDLESILHPLIREESAKRIAAAALPGVPVLYEAALLVETGRYRDFDGLVVVDAPREQRKARLMARNGHSAEMAEKILSAQIADEDRRRAATWILTNSGDLDQLRKEVEDLARIFKSR